MVAIGVYCVNYTKFGQLILRKISEIVATRCQISRPKCTKFDFGWGSAPDPTGGAYSAPPDLLAGFKGPYTSKERGEVGREREGTGRAGRGGEGRALSIPTFYFHGAACAKGASQKNCDHRIYFCSH